MKWIVLLKSALLTMAFVSCHSQEERVTMWNIEVLENTIVYNSKDVSFKIIRDNNKTIFKYGDYSFIHFEDLKEIIIMIKKDTIDNFKLSENYYIIGDDKYTIYKIEEFTSSIDGSMIHYFSPEIGLVMRL